MVDLDVKNQIKQNKQTKQLSKTALDKDQTVLFQPNFVNNVFLNDKLIINTRQKETHHLELFNSQEDHKG